MAAAIYDLSIEQGTTYFRDLTIRDGDENPIDISDWTFRSQIRSTYTSDEILASASIEITDGANGQVNLSFSAADTASIPYRAGRTYVWDLEAVRGDGSVVRLLQGSVTLSPEVTR